MVTIPNGDYSNNKIIIAKLESDQIEPESYTSQLDLMQIFTENILDTNKVDIEDNGELLANENGGSSYKHLYTIYNEKNNLTGYTRLGIAAEFQSLLSNTDTVKGSYGLKFHIYSALPAVPGQIEKDGVYEFYLDAADMIGNPYQFNAFSRQEKVIDISMIQNINKIEVYFYQNGNFKDSNDNLIAWQFINDLIGLDMSNMPNNLYTQNIELFLGYEAGKYESDRMIIHCTDHSSYSYLDYNQDTGIMKPKNLELKWLHKFEDSNENNSKYELVNMNSLTKMGITLKWFKYNMNATNIDQHAGRGWEEIPLSSNNLFKCSFTPNRNNAQERIKVLGYKVNNTYESSEKLINNADYLNEWRQMMEDYNSKEKVLYGKISSEQELMNMLKNGTELYYYDDNGNEVQVTEIRGQHYSKDRDYYKLLYPSPEALQSAQEQMKYKYLDSIKSVDLYESEELILTNQVAVYDSITFNASSSLSIYYEDGSEGNYFIYDSNGRILNQGKGQGYERRMCAVYNGKDINEQELGSLDYIDWYLPVIDQSKTMILQTLTYFKKDKGQTFEDDNYQGVQYIRVRRYPYKDEKTGKMVLNPWQSYSIGSNLNTSALNNLVRCEVSINGTTYVASNTMRFGKQGTQGTNTTIVLEMVDNYNAITVPTPDGIEYSVVGTAYDSQGNVVTISGEWEWDWKTPMVKVGKKPVIEIVPYINEVTKKPISNKIKLQVNENINSLNDISGGYYGILKATFKQPNAINLVAFLSIPLKAPGYSHIEGAQEITYNSSGVPQYYSDAYKIFKEGHEDGVMNNPFTEISKTDWNVVHDINFYKLDKSGKPVINKETGEAEVATMSKDYIPKLCQLLRYNSHGILQTYQALRAAPMFASGYDEICVTCASDDIKDYIYHNIGKLNSDNYIGNYYYVNEADYEMIEEIYQLNPKDENYNTQIQEIRDKYKNITKSGFKLSDKYDSEVVYYELEKKMLWIQPLLITNGVYDYSILNEWDGTLTTDEGAGTIMSALVGAGRKNDNNTFSGILMGDVQDTSDPSIDSYTLIAGPGEMTEAEFNKSIYYIMADGMPQRAVVYDRNQSYYKPRSATGLYGFQDGAISFSLKDNGIATFGKTGRGQIIIDGNESTITSKGYRSSGNGMLLDLDDGQLIIKDNEVKRFILSPQEPYLTINGLTNNAPLVKISTNECFIQSQGKSFNGLGTKLDLIEGILDIVGTGGSVYLSGRDIDPFFKVKTRDGATLIHMDTDEYYLQSAFFNEDSTIRRTDDDLKLEIYLEKQYVPIVLNPSMFTQEYLYDANGNSRYYKEKSANNYVAITTADSFEENIQYYRRGNWDYIYGYDIKNNILYSVNLDEDQSIYTTNAIVDIWETDINGEFLYPIANEVLKYEKKYDNYISIGIIKDQKDFKDNTYYIYDESLKEYNMTNIYDPTKEYFIPDESSEFYIPILVLNMDGEYGYNTAELTDFMIQRYLVNNLEPVMSESIPSGMKLDLVDGRIEGYNLKLIGTNINEDKIMNRLIINTGDPDIPIKVGKNFYIKWNGEMGCTAVKTLSYTKTPLENLPQNQNVYGAEENISNEILTYVLDLENGTFNGRAQSAETAKVANELADAENKFIAIGNENYVQKTKAIQAYGPLNVSNSLDSRINNLENYRQSNEQINSDNRNSIDILNNRVNNLEKLDIATRLDNLEGFNIASLIIRIENIESYIESLKGEENPPLEEV